MTTEPTTKGFRKLLQDIDSNPAITLDGLKECVAGIFKHKVSLEDNTLLLVGPISEGLYQLPDGSLTGKEG